MADKDNKTSGGFSEEEVIHLLKQMKQDMKQDIRQLINRETNQEVERGSDLIAEMEKVIEQIIDKKISNYSIYGIGGLGPESKVIINASIKDINDLRPKEGTEKTNIEKIINDEPKAYE